MTWIILFFLSFSIIHNVNFSTFDSGEFKFLSLYSKSMVHHDLRVDYLFIQLKLFTSPFELLRVSIFIILLKCLLVLA